MIKKKRKKRRKKKKKKKKDRNLLEIIRGKTRDEIQNFREDLQNGRNVSLRALMWMLIDFQRKFNENEDISESF